MVSENDRYQSIANEYRRRQLDPGSRRVGIVMIWDGAAYGWKDRLRNPEDERPGVVAVDEHGQVFVAAGGDDYNGAKAWVAFNEQQG